MLIQLFICLGTYELPSVFVFNSHGSISIRNRYYQSHQYESFRRSRPQVSQEDINIGSVSSETTVSAESPVGPVDASNSSEPQGLEQAHGIDVGELPYPCVACTLASLGQ